MNADDHNIIKAKVLNYTPGCEYSCAEVQIENTKILIQCSPDITLKEEEDINIDIFTKKCHLFDYESEINLTE